MRQKCVADGKQVNIPVLNDIAMGGRRRLDQPPVGWRFKRVGRVLRQIRELIILRRDDETLFKS